MTKEKAEEVACDVETMVMGLTKNKPTTLVIEPNIVVSINYNNEYPSMYIITDSISTQRVDAKTLTCYEHN